VINEGIMQRNNHSLTVNLGRGWRLIAVFKTFKITSLHFFFFVFLKLFPRHFDLFGKGTGSDFHAQLMTSCGGTGVHM
jgi:hypothetical protein